MQESRNSSALAMELRLSCAKPLIWRERDRIIDYRQYPYIRLASPCSLLASLYNPIVNPAMVSTVRFYDRN